MWVGEAKSVRLPRDLDIRPAPTRLAGYRFVHTDLGQHGLSGNDTTELLIHRLDLVAALEVDGEGFPGDLAIVHISPDPHQKDRIRALPPSPCSKLDLSFPDLMESLEEELRRTV